MGHAAFWDAFGRVPHDDMRVWHDALEDGKSIPDVVATMQDYIASLTPRDLAPVPADCRPGRIRDESDIDYWNLRLADACTELWGTDRDGRVITEMSQMFLRASVRVSRLTDDLPPTHS
jgi:hypothetical protein